MMTDSLERVFNVMSNCNCFQTATRVVSLVKMLSWKVIPALFFHPMKVVVMAAYWQRELAVAGAFDNGEPVWNESLT